MMTGDHLAGRIRAALAGRDVREVKMFGGLSFMVDDRILVAVRGGDALLVRIDPERHEELTSRPGASTAMMGKRSMGPSWITVDADRLATDAELDSWLEVALPEDAGS